MNNIAVLLALGLIGLAWWSSLGARNAARRAARKACKRAEVIYIDELALKSLSLGRDRRGMLCLQRTYGFEFYVHGDVRFAGQVTMHARRVARVQMDPYPD